MTRLNSSGVNCHTGANTVTMASLIQTSTAPKAFLITSAAANTASASATSAGAATADPPSSSTSRLASSSASAMLGTLALIVQACHQSELIRFDVAEHREIADFCAGCDRARNPGYQGATRLTPIINRGSKRFISRDTSGPEQAAAGHPGQHHADPPYHSAH